MSGVVDVSQIVLPDLCAALELGLRMQDDSWNKRVLHVTDLAAALGQQAGTCPRQLWLRVRGAPQRDLHAGELLMFDNGKELHLRATSLIGEAIAAVNAGTVPEKLAAIVGPKLNTLKGWRIEKVEHSIRMQAGADLGFQPDPDDDVIDAGTLDIELWHMEQPWVLIADYKTVRGNAMSRIDAEGSYPKHRLQVRTYARARAKQLPDKIVIGGIIFYIDREGQNFARQPDLVTRDDEAVLVAAKTTRALVDSEVAPPILEPTLQFRENKSDDAIYLKEPWQCGRCPFLNHSCPGAVPESVRGFDRVIANRTKTGELKFKPDAPPEALPIVERLLWEGHTLPALEASIDG